MISISFHSNYLAFISLNVDNGKKNIEQSGILYYSVIFNNELINGGKFESFFDVVLNKLKDSLDYYDNEFYISIPTNMVLLDINRANSNTTIESFTKLNDLITKVKYGNEISESFNKKTYYFYDNITKSFLNIYFFKDCIAKIQRAFKNMNLNLNGINVNVFSALNVVYQLHNNGIEKFSLFCFNDENEIEYLYVEGNKITTYLRYKKYIDKLVFYVKTGKISKGIIELLSNDFNDSYYPLTGKIYLVGTKKNQDKIKYYADNNSFINVINPFDEQIKDKKLLVINNLPSYFYNNNMFVEATGTIF